MKKFTLFLIILSLSFSVYGQTYVQENFDTAIPATWTITDAGDATGDSWIFGQQGAGNSLDGSNAAIVDSDTNGNGIVLIETLATPVFDTSTATNVFLDFDQFYNNGGGDRAIVEVFDGAAWVEILNQSADIGGFGAPDQQHINITAYANANMQVRFVYDDMNVWAWYWLIDNVAIYNATCANPDNLVLDSVTSTTANISWTPGGTETAWEVAVQTAGTGIPTGAGTPTTSNAPYVAMSLTPATNYEAYIRADCGGGDLSIWIGPINFATECTTFVAPYTNGFENGGVIPLCWTMSGGEDWDFNLAGPNHVGNNGTLTGSTVTGNYYAVVDASGNDGPSTLTTPFVDVSPLTTPAITFYEISDNEGNANSTLDVEVWDGAAWNLMGTYNTNTSGWEQRTINISTLTITGDVQARFIFSETVTGDFYDDIAIDDVTFDELPSCVNPSNLVADSTTSSTATLSWVSNGTETAWEVITQAPGTGVPTGAGDAATTNMGYVAIGLAPATDYEFYIRADCGGGEYSDWIGPVTFTTECVTFVAPYTEGFENGGTIPICWTMSGGEDWDFNLAGPNHVGNNGTITGSTVTGNYYAVVDASGNDGPSTLTTPFVDVSPLTTPAITFYEISDNEGNANSTLDVEVWDGAAWNLMATYNTNTSGWEQRTINISTLTITGDVQARFIFSETVTGDFYDDIAIDDVTFDELPSCVNPSNIVVDSTTSSTANLSWVSNGLETAWEVITQAPGTGVPTGTGDAATTNMGYVAMGLMAITDYEAYIRADCGGGEYSDWIGPITFTTECVTFVAPYTEGFENGGAIPLCWTMSGGEDWDFNLAGPNHVGNNGTITGTTVTNNYYAVVDASGDNGPTILVTPLVDVTTLTTPALSFYEISDNEGNANSNLDVEVWDGAAWNLMGTYNTNTNGWELFIIDISTLTITGDVQARFTFSELIAPGDFYDDIAIDDVTFDELPTCLTPTNLIASNITGTSADISWVASATGETAWEYVFQLDGTGAPSTNGTPLTVTTVNETGLTPGTAYEFYIRADCGAGDYSLWVGPITFSTSPVNDNCADATSIVAAADGTCTNVSGSLFYASASSETYTCTGTANDDVWFSFVATTTSHAVSLSNIVGPSTFLSHGVYEGADCNNLTNLYCSTDDVSVASGLTIGNTYYIRINTFGDVDYLDVNFDLCVFSVPPPITASTAQFTVQELVEDVLINSPCSSVSNITFSTGTNFGSDNGIGYFEANGSSFPFANGIVMTTGNADNAPGPETGTLSDGGGAGWPGDADLEAEIMEGNTNNASIIEFDFQPFISEMSFEFIFAAEEYGTFQCGFSDAFAFLLTDTVTNVTTNIAVIPGTSTPVSVFTIRDMMWNGNCPSVNPQLFDSYYGPGGLPALTNPTNFLGRTVPLTAMSTVIPNRTYHIKLVIADDGDTAFDSAVFLKGGSFVIGEPDLGEDITLGGGNANCEGDEVLLDIGVPVPDTATITWYTVANGIQEPILDDTGLPENGPTLGVTETGTYQVEIVLNANAACFVIDQILVEFFENPAAQPSPTVLSCDTDNSGVAIFDLTTNEAIITDGDPDVTVTYYTTEQDALDGTNPIANTTTYTSAPTTIYVRVESNITGCSKVTNFLIAIAPKPLLTTADNIQGCDNDQDGIANYDLTSNEETIVNSQPGFIFSYYLTVTDADASTNAISNPTDYDSTPGTIVVRVEDAMTGCFETTTFDLLFGIAPQTTFTTDFDYEVCPNATVPIIVTATPDNYTAAEVSIVWYNEGVLVSGQNNLSIDNVLTAGTYSIEVTFNDTGCSASQDIIISELETCVIPQGISPNGDGLNDIFDLSSYDVQSLQVFNRNGTLVYEKTNYLDEWHGQSVDGDELPVGTYYYVMNYQGSKTKAAWVYINR